MKKNTTDKIYVIKDTSSGLFWKAGSKVAWATIGAAKNAWNLHEGRPGNYLNYYKDRVYFDNQSQYILVELTDSSIS